MKSDQPAWKSGGDFSTPKTIPVFWLRCCSVYHSTRTTDN
jgi:hypothetical protein